MLSWTEYQKSAMSMDQDCVQKNSDSERFVLDPCTQCWAQIGAGIKGKPLAGNLHFWTQPYSVFPKEVIISQKRPIKHNNI